MTIQPRFGKFPPLASGLLTKLLYNRVELAAGRYQSTIADYQLDLEGAEYVERCFALRGFFEWRIAAIASLVVQPGDTVFEGGAHIGTETFNYAALVGAAGQVISFEADARLAQLLTAKLSRAGLTQCRVQSKALGDKPGVAYFDSVVEEGLNTGLGALASDSELSGTARVEVQMATLDDAVAEFGAPRLLVMDIQGGELGALRGGTRMLTEHRPFVVLEVESRCLEPLGASAQEILDLFREHNYTCWRFTRLGLNRVESVGDDEFADWLVVPNESAEVVKRVKNAFTRGALLPPQSRLSPLSTLRR